MAEEIVSRLVAKVDGFLRGFDQAERKVKDFSTKGQRDVQTFQNQMQTLSRVISTVFVSGAVARMIQKTVEFGDQLDKNSRRLGVQTRDLAALQFAAERAGVGQEELARGIAQAQKNLLDFSRGTGEARVELQALGIDQAKAAELLKSPLEAFLTVGDAVNRSVNKTATAMKVLGESGRVLIPMFEGGRQELDKLTNKYNEAAGDIERLAFNSARFADQMTDVGAALTGLQTRGLNPVLPSLERLFKQFEDFLNSSATRGFVEFLGTTTSLLIDLATAAGTLIGGGASVLVQAVTGNFEGAREVLLQMKADIEKLRDDIVNPPAIPQNQPETLETVQVVEQAESKRLANLIAIKEAKIELLQLDEQNMETARFLVFNLQEEVAALKESLAIQKEKEASVKAGTAADPQVARLAALEKEIALQKIAKEEAAAIGEIQAQVGSEVQSRLENEIRLRQRLGQAELAEAEFQLQLTQKNSFADPLLDVALQQLEVLDRQLLVLKNRLEVEGQSLDVARQLKLVEAEREDIINRVNAAEQRGLGQTIVGNATAANAAAFGPIDAKLRAAREALAIGDLRKDAFGDPLQLPGTRILRQIDQAQAERERLQLSFQQTGDQDTLSELRIKTVEIEELQKAFENLDFVNLKTQVESFGSAISGAINTTVQGVLLGTQSIGDAWNNMIRNILLQIVNQTTQQLVGNAIKGLIGLLPGAATGNHGGLVMKFAGGGMVPGLGFSDTVPAFLTPGEGVISRTGMEALARINQGHVTGAAAPQIVINNYSGEPVSTQEERTPGGGFKTHVFIGGQSAKDLRGRGDLYKAMLETFQGLRPRTGLR